jgi:SAM-dependent methyltransferase
MRQVAAENSRGQRGDRYGGRRPMSGGGRPQGGPRGPVPYGERGPAGPGRPYRDSRGPRPDSRGPRPDRPYRGERSDRGDRGPRPDRPPYRDRNASAGPGPSVERRPQPAPYAPDAGRGPHGPRRDRPYRTGVQSAGEGPPRPSPAPEEPPLGRIRALLSGYQSTAVMLAAHSLGVFRHLHQRPQNLDDLTRAAGADRRGMEALLEALVGLGVIHRHGPTFVLPRDFAPYLVPGVDGDATGMIDATPDYYMAWMELARAVREGTPRHRLSTDALLAGDPDRPRRYLRSVHTGGREAARRLVELAPALPGSKLLDVGGGSGIYAAEYARRTPDLHATLFEIPPAIDAARDILRTEGLEDAIEYVPGDYRKDPLPGPVDTILLSNVLQTESEENAILLLRKAREALNPGGTLLIHGLMPDGSGGPASGSAMASLVMFMYFDHGKAWTLERVSEWLVQEGFGVRSSRPLGAPFHTRLLTATRIE